MSGLVVVVKSHLFPQFVRLNREIGTKQASLGRWRVCGCQSQATVGGHDTRELHGAAAVESIAMDGQSIGSKAAAAVTHNSNSQLVRRTRYTVGGHTANTDTRVISGGRRGSVVLAGERTPGKAAAVTRERGEVARAACSLALARAVSCTWAAPGQRENTETVAKQKQLPSAGLAPSYHARGARPEDHMSANY